jgi:DNA invertase Pin-like site-specific DNA recombinase
MPKPAKRRVAIYARVSTQDQDPQMQLRELRSYAKHRTFTIAHEFIDHVSGATSERPELSKLWQSARARKIDTVLVWKFDRFARSTKQLIDALEEFRHLGVDFISITEQIDTSSPMGKAMFTVISAIAEFERSLISERVRSGIAKARAQGKQHGRPKTSAATIKEIKRLRRQGKSLNYIAKQLGVSHQTVANYS